MAKTLAMILADTKSLVKDASVKASFTKAAIAGTNPSSMPGSEHDKPTPAEAKEPNKEVKDETMVPNSGLSAAGAKDDSPVTRGQALDATESAQEPKKKPAITADANAKEASDGTASLANEILAMIAGAQKEAAAPVVKVAAPVASAPVVPGVAPKVEKKSAGLNMELTSDVLAKTAAMLLSTDEGVKAVDAMLRKQAGAEAAQVVFDFLGEQAALAEKQAAFEQGAADAQAEIDRQIYEAGVKAGSAQRGLFHKLGQAAADASLEGAGTVPGGAEAAGSMGDAAMAPEGADGAGGEPGAEGGQEDVTLEDIAEALQALVADGTLQPDEAEQVLQKLLGEEGGGEPGAEGGAGAEGAGAPPPVSEAPGAAPADDTKVASASKATAILAAIKALKQ